MKLIMVDLDGTLFDTRLVNYFAYQKAIEPYGFSIDYGYYCDFCNGRYYMDFLPQITTYDKKILSDIHMQKKQLYENYLEYAVLNQSLVTLLKSCRIDYKIALVTTASKKNTYDIIRRFDLTGLFDLILTQDDITEPKPNPMCYIKAMEYFNVKPEDCIVFEDAEVGIEAAEKAGVFTLVVKGYN